MIFIIKTRFKPIFLTFLIFYLYCNLTSQTNTDEILKSSIVPIIKIGPRIGRAEWLLKYPVGTAFLVSDSTKYSSRIFIVTAKHVIENDSATICLINFASQNASSEISTSVRKYVIYKNEWKFHPQDSIDKFDKTKYYGFDVAVAEVFIFRIQLDNQMIWHRPINLKWLINSTMQRNDSAKIIAFPFVNKFNFDRGLAMGDLEIDNGTIANIDIPKIRFEDGRYVRDLNEILIVNPKYRPGYSGGLVFSQYLDIIKIFGMAMGISSIRSNGPNKYCFGYFIDSANILETIKFNFLKK